MGDHPSTSDLAYLDPENGESLVTPITTPPQARTVLDVKDRQSSGAGAEMHRPFITFDFEPDDLDIDYYQSYISRRREPRSESCHVPIDHFDPEGVHRIRTRFSEVSVSEYTGSAPDSLKNPSSTSIPFSKSEDTIDEGRQAEEFPQEAKQVNSNADFAASEATLVPPSIIQVVRPNGPKQVRPAFDMEFAMREILKRRALPPSSSGVWY